MEDIALSFLLSVLAGIIANYISKRLDEREKGNKPEPRKKGIENPPKVVTWGDFRVHVMEVALSFLPYSV